MSKDFWGKFKEATISVVPLSIIIILITIFVGGVSLHNIISFILCSILMIFGMAFFTIGADMSMMKMGGYIGSNLSKSRKFSWMVLCAFMIGFIVTIAEPDLSVLASQVPGINKWVFLIAVSLGVGIFLILALVRILFKVRLSTLLIISYGFVFLLMFFLPQSFVPMAFDASGVTTGPISVPFIMAFGLGITAVRSGKSTQDDGFGMIALASVGPILAIMILGLFVNGGGETIASAEVVQLTSFSEIFKNLGTQILVYLKDVLLVLLPIAIFFYIFNHFVLKYPIKQLLRLGIGLCYAYVGIVLFLACVNTGFLPIGSLLGQKLASLDNNWILIPIGVVFGFFVVFAEPAVHVLNKQVEDLTGGVIKKRVMLISISIGVALSVMIAIIRNLLQINLIYFLIPILLLSLILSIYNSNIFTGIAFDSGGVASGALTSTFILPFILSVSNTLGNNILMFGFGSVAMICITPVLVIQIMGCAYKIIVNKKNKAQKRPRKSVAIEVYEYDV